MFDHKTVYPATEAWLTELTKPYLHFIREEHDGLLASHRALTGGGCYLVGGSIFGPGGVRPPKLDKLKPLPAQLLPAHQAWLANCDRHGAEWVRAQQVLRTAIGRAENWQDVRDMIPDHVLRPFPATGLMELTRQRPDLYAGQPSDPNYAQERAARERHWDIKLLDLYEQVAPTIDLYVSYRLL